MASIQEFFGGTQNPGVPVRALRMGNPIIMGFSHLMAVIGAVRTSYRI